MPGPVCLHPGMDPGSLYRLAPECSSVSDVSPHDEESVDTSADGEEGSRSEPTQVERSHGVWIRGCPLHHPSVSFGKSLLWVFVVKAAPVAAQRRRAGRSELRL